MPEMPTLPADTDATICHGKPNNYFVENLREGCDSYFVCFRNEATPLKCAAGLLFDAGRQMCYWADKVRCRRNRCAGRPDNSFVERPGGGCKSYARCESGKPIPLTCPEPFHFNARIQECDWSTRAECRPSPCIGRADHTYLVDNTRGCEAFLYCLGGEAIKEECPDNLYFDEVNQICNYPEKVNCRKR
jgi:hypothetical protein